MVTKALLTALLVYLNLVTTLLKCSNHLLEVSNNAAKTYYAVKSNLYIKHDDLFHLLYPFPLFVPRFYLPLKVDNNQHLMLPHSLLIIQLKVFFLLFSSAYSDRCKLEW